ncbi:hypothetical protein BH09BAC5_BH09BAC5_02860 [soil metagenome]
MTTVKFRSASFVKGFGIHSEIPSNELRQLIIELNPDSTQNLSMTIFDVIGHVLYEKKADFFPEKFAAIDVSDYKCGLYFLQFENYYGQIQTERFEIN